MRLALPEANFRFRSLAHEGDTPFAQPRDYNYPTIAKQLEQTGATVVLVCFGQSEALARTNRVTEFVRAYGTFLDQVSDRRIMLVSPMAFEAKPPPLPDLSQRNAELRQYVLAIQELARERGMAFVNLFDGALGQTRPTRVLTSDGLHLTSLGHWHYDSMLAQGLGAKLDLTKVSIDPISGTLSEPKWEQVRQVVVAKNRLWFSYYRPMNWAFLGGDRIDQPSSRDYRDPKIRWFPDEMRRFVPLIEKAESEAAELARK